ncbi:MAG TPA: hypothetical protein VI548_01935 [Chitinophagaceae bacterium]|nr:hypothetical protein [Chitinophagaceae bacterium]
MKKVLAPILLLLYITTSSGIVINLHYCMNRLTTAKMGIVKSEVCSKCGMSTKEGNKCCHSEVKVIKIQDVQKLSELNYNFSTFKILADRPSVIFNELLASVDNFSFVNNHSPPISKQDIWLVNCVFRI